MHRLLLLLLALVTLSAPATAEVRTLTGAHAEGYLRARFRLFKNLDLNNGGYSGVLSPLLDQAVNKGLGTAPDLTSGFTSRLRVGLGFDLADGFRIATTLDVVDEHLFGGVGAYPRAGDGIAILSDGSAPADHTWLRVKEAYGVVRPFRNVEVTAGRRDWHWGLGAFYHDGRGEDAEYGAYTDGIGGSVRLFESELGIMWDVAYEGPVSGNRWGLDGQPHALENLDDVGQWRLWARGVMPDLEWGVLSLFRDQQLSSEQARWQAFGEGYCAISGSDELGLNWDCYGLTPRGYFLWSPDVYVIWRAHEWVTLAAEAMLQYGSIDHARNSSVNDVSGDVLAAGGFLKLEVDPAPWHAGLEAAIATGTEGVPRAFGVGYDPEGIGHDQTLGWNGNGDLHHAFFARDHHVDLILFREIIGTFTDAFLVALPLSWDALTMGTHRVRVGLRPVASWTYHSWEPLGFETDAWAEYTPGLGFSLRLDAGWLLPLAGLDNPVRPYDADSAFSFQSRLIWSF